MSCTWHSNCLLNSMCYNNYKGSCHVLVSFEATVKTAANRLSWKSTVRRKEGKGRKKKPGKNLGWICSLKFFIDLLRRGFFVVVLFFSHSQCSLIFAFWNLRIKNYIFFCCFSFSYSFKRLLLIFTQRFITPAFIYILFPVILFITREFYQGNASFFFNYYCIWRLVEENSAIQQERVVFNHLHWKDRFVWCLFCSSLKRMGQLWLNS